MKKLFINVFIILSVLTLSSCKTKVSNEDVKTDYQVQIDNSQVVSGKDDMKAFYEKTKSNIKATIKIIMPTAILTLIFNFFFSMLSPHLVSLYVIFCRYSTKEKRQINCLRNY